MPANPSTPEVTRALNGWLPLAHAPKDQGYIWVGRTDPFPFADFMRWEGSKWVFSDGSYLNDDPTDAYGKLFYFPLPASVTDATPARGRDELRDLIAKIIDPTAWRQHDDRLDMIRIQQEGDRSSPDSESHWQAAATHVVHPSRMKADEIIAAFASTDMAGAGEGLPREAEQADGMDENACTTDCTRCGSNGWIVDLAALASADKDQRIQQLEAAMATVIVNLHRDPEKAPAVVVFARAIMRGVPLQEAVAKAEKANDPSSIVEVSAPPVERLTSGEGDFRDRLAMAISNGEWADLAAFLDWAANHSTYPNAYKTTVDDLYARTDRAAAMLAASPKATATASVREKIARIVCEIVVRITCPDYAKEDSIQGQINRSWHHWTETADRILATLTDSGTAATIGGERA